MSSHHSQKAIGLHHSQVQGGKDRREQDQADRVGKYTEAVRQHRFERNFQLVCGFICFAYTLFATAAYTGYIISA